MSVVKAFEELVEHAKRNADGSLRIVRPLEVGEHISQGDINFGGYLVSQVAPSPYPQNSS